MLGKWQENTEDVSETEDRLLIGLLLREKYWENIGGEKMCMYII